MMNFYRANSSRNDQALRVSKPASGSRISGCFALLLSSTVLAACVGSADSTLSLSSDQVSQPLDTASQVSLDVNADALALGQSTETAPDAGAQTLVGGVAVPVRSPNASAAANSTTPKPDTNTELAVVTPVEAPSAAGTVIEGNLSQGAVTEETVEVAALQAPSENAATTEISADEVNEAAAVSEPAANTPSQPSKEKGNLFQRLFGSKDADSSQGQKPKRRINPAQFRDSRDSSRVRVASAHRTAKAKKADASKRQSILLSRARIARANQNGNLPGVKSRNALFGITDNSEASGSDNTQLAAVGGLGRLSPNGLRVQHEKVQVACLKPGVLRLLKLVERRYGSKPIITSGYRSPKRNRRAGGASNSLHIYCKAVDIQVEGVSKWELAKYLRTIPGRGGVGTYCRTRSVHLDVGSKRDWHHPCRRSKVRKRKKA